MTEAERERRARIALVRDADVRETERGYTDPARIKAMRLKIEAHWAKREAQLAELGRNAKQVRRFARG